MRKSGICPKCEGRQFWRIEKVMEATHGGYVPLAVTVETKWGGLSSHVAGTFETVVCAACGYTEWYANGLEKLKADPEKGIYFVDNLPKPGAEGPER